MRKNISNKLKSIQPSVTLAITAKAKSLKAQGIDIIGFGAGEPDFRTPKHIRDAAINAIENESIGYTAASGMESLKKAICDKLKRDNNLEYTQDQIVVSNGAKHSLFNTLSAICNPGDEVIVPNPYWVSYPELVRLVDANPVFVECPEEAEFKYTVEALEAAITDKTKAIILNTPNNPTGTAYKEEDLRAIADLAVKHNIYVISDEIYEKLLYEGTHTSIASFNQDIKDLAIVVNGVAKAYAMTGWRIGYTACNKEIAKAMSNFQSHATSNPNTIAQYATIAALNGPEETLNEMIKAFKERRDFMVEKINSIENLSCLNPQGAFYVMVNISKLIGKTINGKAINNSVDFADYLLDDAKVAVVPGIGFGNDNYIRLSYATSLDNIKEGLNRIEKAIAL
ncbi:MAG: pyridoxal phosphate-dependent aminotransferase [Paeniclostridium sordellii]|uniref:Aminotransferase n=1 Tax=Paeniclostridium hominis TaxID=2764329 RepID=A0ABR7K6K0_9FIRM|nr:MULTISPECIES: pyridoxal phosphate-dependent aminotransferase [Paeniclostridium]MBC6004733.1 pyridoxal phosphate-dependent aminotransferase [Paeniclostridium hominis]MDU2591899.1 pyridoxal phosphate-dependent aminotransferase [Paeniclostridium sordellii]